MLNIKCLSEFKTTFRHKLFIEFYFELYYSQCKFYFMLAKVYKVIFDNIILLVDFLIELLAT